MVYTYIDIPNKGIYQYFNYTNYISGIYKKSTPNKRYRPIPIK